ncbi:MAG: hypothetical protein LBS71_00595 [Puniceicoccales bacterium]|jgi:hypothetical protein|nr:hypothetical protein [Puniceicoccales bacterium]
MMPNTIVAAEEKERQDLISFAHVAGIAADDCLGFFSRVGQCALSNGKFLMAAAALMGQQLKGPKFLGYHWSNPEIIW